jgi:hypothetical protein
MMKLTYLPVLLVLLALCGASYAVSAEEYCQEQATPCVKLCCPKIGGTWSDAEQDCIYSGSDNETLDDMLNGPCGSCAAQMITCITTYHEPPVLPPTQPPSSSGCCLTGALLAFIGAAAFLRRS